jgi:hypothetical protein
MRSYTAKPSGSTAETNPDKSDFEQSRPTDLPDRNLICLVYPDGSITTVSPQPSAAYPS